MRTPPFFIIGAPRSGTTMLQMALNRHSAIAIPPETAFFTMVTRPTQGQHLHWQRINKDLGINVTPPPHRIHPGEESREWFDTLRDAYLATLRQRSITRFGEKSPEHLRRMPLILEAYPQAQVILVVRDGRDVALSLTKVPWMPNDLYIAFQLWLHYCRLQRALMNQMREQLHVVHYETFVRNPVPESKRLLAFLKLPYEPDVAVGAGNHEGVPSFELSYKSKALAPISDGSIGRWKRELSSRQASLLERTGYRELASLGYDVSSTHAKRPPLAHNALVYVRCALWLGSRWAYRVMDEYFGTRWHSANRTLIRAN